MEVVVLRRKSTYRGGSSSEYFETLVANPDNFVRTTSDISEARQWNDESRTKTKSKARTFARENGLLRRGFEPMWVET